MKHNQCGETTELNTNANLQNWKRNEFSVWLKSESSEENLEKRIANLKCFSKYNLSLYGCTILAGNC